MKPNGKWQSAVGRQGNSFQLSVFSCQQVVRPKFPYQGARASKRAGNRRCLLQVPKEALKRLKMHTNGVQREGVHRTNGCLQGFMPFRLRRLCCRVRGGLDRIPRRGYCRSLL